MPTLNKFSGTWTSYLAAHLFRRTTYGVNIDTIKLFGNKSLDECIQELFTPIGPPPPPLNNSYDADPDVPIGQTWVDKTGGTSVNGYRRASMSAWAYELMINGGPNIREKLTMFWHNHFVIADENDPRYTYKYIELLRANAAGNFKQLTKDITVDPAMLIYLNGRDNSKQAPNENFARELMELFTLGKGIPAGPGDYTTFTEEDVKQVAKSLTGWQDVRANLPLRSAFIANRHDTTNKQLSHRFGNAVINNANEEEYKNLIDIIFQREEVALFIARKLYRWFIRSGIDSQTEQEIIIPMAALIRDNNYEIAPALKALLSSEHFYEECVIGAIIKNPIDFLINPLNQFNAPLPADAALKQKVIGSVYGISFAMQMAMFQAPNVAGWQAYYQEPNFYRLWLNATSLPQRKGYTDGLASGGITFSTFKVQLNALNTLDKFSNPSDIENVIDEFTLLLFCKPLAENQRSTLKELLLLGGTPQTWTTIYTTYIQDPTNETKKTVVYNRIKNLLVYMMRMPEIHLS